MLAMRTLLIPAAAAAILATSSLVFAATQTNGTVKSYDSHAMTLTLADGSTYTLKKGVKAPALKAGEKVTVDVPLVFSGEAVRGALVNHELNSLTVLAPATDIPNELHVSIADMAIGSHLSVADIALPEGVEAAVEGDVVVVSLTQAPVQDLGEGSAEAATEDDTAAE